MSPYTEFLLYIQDHNASRGVCLAFLCSRTGDVTFYPARKMEIGG